MGNALYSSQRADWATPRGLFADLHEEFGFTLDVCATEANACLPRYLTERDEALMHSYSADVTEPTCVTILQPGYKIGDRILRPARVAVARRT